MSLVETLHQEHKARLARIAAKAVKPPGRKCAVDIRETEPAQPAIDAVEQWVERQKQIHKAAWFQIMDGPTYFEQSPAPLKVKAIKTVVCAHFGISENDLVSARRYYKFVVPRHVAMYLCRELTPYSFPEISRRIGRRDHTVAMYASRKIETMMANDKFFREEVECLIERLGGRPA